MNATRSTFFVAAEERRLKGESGERGEDEPQEQKPSPRELHEAQLRRGVPEERADGKEKKRDEGGKREHGIAQGSGPANEERQNGGDRGCGEK